MTKPETRRSGKGPHFHYSDFFGQWSAFSIVVFLVAGSRSLCSSPPLERFEFSSPHMGTLFSITLYAAEKNLAQIAAQAAFQQVAHLDDIMSDYKADSELVR